MLWLQLWRTVWKRQEEMRVDEREARLVGRKKHSFVWRWGWRREREVGGFEV